MNFGQGKNASSVSRRWVVPLFIFSSLITAGLTRNSAAVAATNPAFTKIAIEPESSLLFGAKAEQRVIVTAQTAAGIERDLTRDAAFTSANSEIATIDASGKITAHQPGFVRITATAGDLTASSRVLVVDSTHEDKIDFVRDIEPIFTMKGCNNSNCHGSMHGKNGFKLSQFGYEPQLDYGMIVDENDGRRVNRQDPARSLIVLKPTSQEPHGGGTRFDVDSQEYRALVRWIAQGAPKPEEGSPLRIEKLQVVPGERVMAAPGATQQLVVLAHYSDRTIRDITNEVRFVPKDESIASAAAGGLVTANREGETAILVRATGALGVARIAVLSGRTIENYPKQLSNNFIDEHVFGKLRRLQIVPSELSTDDVFMRRAYLDTIGTLPTSKEVRAFLADRSAEKRARLVDNLLDRPEYAEYWGLLWSDLLTIASFKTGPSQTIYLDQWVRQQLRDNVPFDQFARKLVAGEGLIRENPGIALAASRPPEQAASYFSQLFLGVHIQCAQCHDHPFEQWKQKDYWGMVAFFSQVSTRNSKAGQLLYDDGKKETKSPVTGKPVPPQFLGAAEPLAASATSRREKLAEWITAPGNPFFARAIANRIWAHYMNVGLVEPVDDFRETNPPTNPQLLDALAGEFANGGYDLKKLMRAVMNSRAYQLSATSNETNANDEQQYSHYYMRRIYAEPLLDAVTQVTAAPHQFKFGYAGMKAVELSDAVIPDSFLQTFDRNRRETVCERGENITLGQTLKLISGDALNEKLRFQGGALDKLVDKGFSDDKIIEEFYLSGLSRYPTAEESAALLDAIKSSKSRRQGLEDVLWALVNSREFLFNH